uniref:Calponin-homology (CH) domain-containing protein n=1 Tax=Globodera pallida TaxID=36090 RepID=A0A183C826_GLOPA
MIAYSVTVEVIEDGTPEKEDLAKALALSKRFFWRTMMEEWDCNKQGELQLSSAMEAIKAAYRVLFGWREAKGFNTKFDFENESRFLNARMILSKELGLDMEMICKQKMNEERYVANVFFQYIYLVRDPMVKTYPDQLKALEPVQDPCEEAKLKQCRQYGNEKVIIIGMISKNDAGERL